MNIVIRNEKLVSKHEPYCWQFCLNLKYLGWQYRKYIKTAKMVVFVMNCSVKMTLRLFFGQFLLLWLWCQSLETVQKIATDQKGLFGVDKHRTYTKNDPLRVRVILTMIKCWSSYSYSACANREPLDNFENKSVSSPFSWVSRYVLFLA